MIRETRMQIDLMIDLESEYSLLASKSHETEDILVEA
jgi:hypothetical protein